MATSIIQTAEDQITCTICLEIFQEPKALPCLHSFCKKCISNYIIEGHSQNPHRNGYHCPVCRRYVSVPLHMKQNPKRWVDQLVSNHVISTMIDAYRTPTKTEHCKEHPQKELGHFCVDHNKSICSICCQDHRQCNYVLTQNESQIKAERLKNSDAVKLSRQSNLEQDLSLLSEQCDLLEKTIDKERNTWTFLHQSDQHLRGEIYSMRKRISELIRQRKDEKVKDISTETNNSSEQTYNPKDEHVHTIKLPFQGKPSWITGIVILPSGKLLLVDHANAVLTVQSLFLNCVCSTNIHPAPYDVVCISSTHDQVLMSIPDTQELLRCDVSQDGSVLLGRKLKTSITCKAIASDDRYVAVCSSSELQIFETDGELWMLNLDESYESTKFTYVTMTSSEQKVFITDQIYSEPHIKCMNFHGDTLWKVADRQIGICTGICVTGTQILVTSKDSGKIFSLSFNGDDLKAYSSNTLLVPWKLHTSSRQNIICVSQHNRTLSEEDRRLVKAFHIKSSQTDVTMATSIIQTAEDQITCTICLEIFQEPKALPCLHSFCKKCISNYIIERHSQNPHRNGYHCPVCRRYVSVPLHMKQNPKRWVDQLVSNHVISTMIDAYRTPTKTEHCKEHPQKELGHFCVDNNKSICSICCQDHRQCNYVLTQNESQIKAERLKNSDAVKLSRQSNLEQDLSLLSEQCDLLEKTIDKERNTWTFLHQSDQHLRGEIYSMRKRISELIRQRKDEKVKDISTETNNSSEQTYNPNDEHVHTIKLPFQGKPSWITGIVILPSGKLLLVDHANAVLTVQSLFLNCVSSTNIHPAPYDVVCISSTHDQVLMSIPDTQELLRCDVSQDGSVLLGRKLKTSITCKAIASDDRYVAVCSSSELQIFETDGELWMLNLDESYESTKFTYVTMTSSEQKVFITDQIYSEPHIKCMNFDGDTLWKVADRQIGICTGICVTGTQILVTSKDSGKIFSLSFNGDDLKAYRSNTLLVPWKLHTSSRQNIICVSQHNRTLSEEDRRLVKAFHII
ncbi:uncharacterized protein [Argopecten irradians]|uniref:uncharacterized protein n=1 Tax=Argopecten irradians TaxID=31199 RepID=UPI00371D628C